jgi:hypothetical protein
MALFGGSETKTTQVSSQFGVEAGGDAKQYYAGGNLSVIDEFPEPVAAYAQGLLGLTSEIIAGQSDASANIADTLGTIAAREKTPLTEWLPFAAVGAAALVAISFWSK